jgi:hypothetical protein
VFIDLWHLKAILLLNGALVNLYANHPSTKNIPMIAAYQEIFQNSGWFHKTFKLGGIQSGNL